MSQILYCVYEKKKRSYEQEIYEKNWDCITGVCITGADGSSGADVESHDRV